MQRASKTFLGLIAIAPAMCVPALADDMSYSFIELAYIDTEIDAFGTDIDGDGVGVGLSFELGEIAFLTATFSLLDFDFGIDLTQFTVGLGGRYAIN